MSFFWIQEYHENFKELLTHCRTEFYFAQFKHSANYQMLFKSLLLDENEPRASIKLTQFLRPAAAQIN